MERRGRPIGGCSYPTGPDVEADEFVHLATGTDDAGPVRCHQNRHHSGRETVLRVRPGASQSGTKVPLLATTNAAVKRGCAARGETVRQSG